jgi:hypothetical protein
VNKLPLVNLPKSDAPLGAYERQMEYKVNQSLSAHRATLNCLIDKRTSIPVYANNAAAIAGGLIEGDFYRTGGDPSALCIVHA